ncbi:cupin domain-containing protein [Thioalkalivibrio paradoxus]|uniref:Anti-sigma factor n=1 Tax=Thioalkalivibrio paradoxus ARh 1 TaxID=713585 RepID=W0DLS2_9GAMM|nr:cupin domain-containing protein [Thioalkalivibrio paradoxus]AHE98177.1 anti-sigma factor [Thioalkalivibrio paradoxus ARh 1]
MADHRKPGDGEPLDEDILVALLSAQKPVPPDRETRDRIWARLRQLRVSGAGHVTRKSTEGMWFDLRPGIRVKPLHADRRAGYRSFLMQLEPGARYPSHSHDQDEECVVLKGTLRIGNLEVHEGDYHLAQCGSEHGELHSDEGALIFLRTGYAETAPGFWQRMEILGRTLRARLRG